MSQFDAGKITLQSGDSIGYSFKFPIASTSTANDGCVPYGRTISTVDVTAYDEDGDDVTTDLISGTPGLVGDTVSVVLKWPGEVGRYKLTFLLTLDNAWQKEVDFKNVYARAL